MSDGELRQTMKRLMSIHDEIDEKKLDLKTVYSDAKSAGYDKTALGLAIRQIRGREKNETPAAQERSAMVELYVSAFDNAPRTYVHVPAREKGSESAGRASSLSGDAAVQAPDARTQEDGHVDRSASAQPDCAEGRPAIPSMPGDAGNGQGSQTGTTGRPSGAGTGSAVRDGVPVSNTSLGPLTAAQNEGAAGANPVEAAPASATESEVVTPQAQGAEFVTPVGEGEGGLAPADPSPAAERPKFARKEHVLRPHCQRPEMCGSYGSKHCAQCERAAKAGEDDGADVPAFVRKTHNHIAMGDQA